MRPLLCALFLWACGGQYPPGPGGGSSDPGFAEWDPAPAEEVTEGCTDCTTSDEVLDPYENPDPIFEQEPPPEQDEEWSDWGDDEEEEGDEW
jgi:hypothetical protein